MMHPKRFAAARDLTGGEVSAYRKSGWARLPGLISRADAGAMLERANDILNRARNVCLTGRGTLEDCWFTWDNGAFQALQMTSPLFHEFVLSEAMGRAASKLIGRQRLTDRVVPIRAMAHLLFCKTGSQDRSSEGIDFHQDGSAYRVDRAGLVTIWIALDDLRPEQGTMRFLEGSHKEGPLGDHRGGPALERYPKLRHEYELSAPLSYDAGDATAHDGFMLHGSPENLTQEPRWGYACLYVADDVRFDQDVYKDKPQTFKPPLEQQPIVFS